MNAALGPTFPIMQLYHHDDSALLIETKSYETKLEDEGLLKQNQSSSLTPQVAAGRQRFPKFLTVKEKIKR